MIMSQESTVNNVPAIYSSSVPTQHEMMVYQTMAKQAVSSKLYRGIGDESGVMTIMLAAREIGIPPMAALNGGLNIIQGKVEISARMMNSLIRKAGHSLQIKTSTEEICEIIGKRRDTGETETVSFTMEQAKRAGLVKEGGGWKKFPEDMLYARCLSRLARRLFSDVIGVGYVEGEIKEATYEVVEPVPQSPQENNEDEEKRKQMLIDFLSKFDKEEAMAWINYIGEIQSKLGVTIEQFMEKYDADPEKVTANFNKWRNKQLKQTQVAA